MSFDLRFDLHFDYSSAKIKLSGITAAYNHILCLSFPVTSFVYRFLFLLHAKWVRLPALYGSVKCLALYKPHKITASVLCRTAVLKAAFGHREKSWKADGVPCMNATENKPDSSMLQASEFPYEKSKLQTLYSDWDFASRTYRSFQ